MRSQSYRAFGCAQSDFILCLRSTYLLTIYRCSERKKLVLIEETHSIAAEFLRVNTYIPATRYI